MKKLAIVLLCLLTLYMGFLFYKKINQGIDAFNYQQMDTIDLTHAKALPVDERDVFESYTYQLTTYPRFDTDLLKSTIHYSHQEDRQAIRVCHMDEEHFIINSFEDFSTVDKEVSDITGPYVVIWPETYTLKTGVKGDLYQEHGLYYMLVTPINLDQVWFDFDSFSLKISLSDL